MTTAETAVYSGPVTELAIRILNEGQDVAAFAATRDAFVARLKAQPGVVVDREFMALVDGLTFTPPAGPVFTGMTEYENMAAFATAGEALGNSAEAGAFFSTFSPAVFTALRPKNPADRYHLATLANQPGQVLEVAVRNLGSYADFDAADYETRLNNFLGVLAQQPGFVAEYQWVSVVDANIVVGMTVYESADAFQALAGNQTLLATMMPFIQDYPPFTAYIHADARQG